MKKIIIYYDSDKTYFRIITPSEDFWRVCRGNPSEFVKDLTNGAYHSYITT